VNVDVNESGPVDDCLLAGEMTDWGIRWKATTTTVIIGMADTVTRVEMKMSRAKTNMAAKTTMTATPTPLMGA